MIKRINTNWYCNLLCLLKLSYYLQLDYIHIKYTKKILVILNLLIKVNYINNYKILSNNTLIIYLLYKNNKPYWNNLKIYYRSSKFFFITVHLLKRFYFNEFKKILILSTSKGIITHLEAIKFNHGGKLVFLLY
jgi:ribosomal protein S8